MWSGNSSKYRSHTPLRADLDRALCRPCAARYVAAPDLTAARLASLRHHLVGVQMLEALQLDSGVEVGRDAIVRQAVSLTLHVRLEAVPITPAADHDQLLPVAIRAPDLQAEEAIPASK